VTVEKGTWVFEEKSPRSLAEEGSLDPDAKSYRYYATIDRIPRSLSVCTHMIGVPKLCRRTLAPFLALCKEEMTL